MLKPDFFSQKTRLKLTRLAGARRLSGMVPRPAAVKVSGIRYWPTLIAIDAADHATCRQAA
jgi:hypothetical protein